MRKVIRIEHATEKYKSWWDESDELPAGPFNLELIADMDDEIRERMYNPPGPRFSLPSKSYIFGFADVGAMLNWFQFDMLEEVTRLGYVIAVYEVANDNVIDAEHKEQLAFDYAKANRIAHVYYEGPRVIEELKRYA